MNTDLRSAARSIAGRSYRKVGELGWRTDLELGVRPPHQVRGDPHGGQVVPAIPAGEHVVTTKLLKSARRFSFGQDAESSAGAGAAPAPPPYRAW